MKGKLSIVFVVLLTANLLILGGCSSSKTPVSEADWHQVKNKVNAQNFTFIGNTVETYGSVEEVLSINPGYLKMENDQVNISLRYFGNVEVANTYRASGRIQVEGTMLERRTNHNESEGSYDLNFLVQKNKSETLQCNLKVFPSMQAQLTLNSNLRSPALYYGYIE